MCVVFIEMVVLLVGVYLYGPYHQLCVCVYIYPLYQ